MQFPLSGGLLLTSPQFVWSAIEILEFTCWEIEKPIITSPSGTSQDTVAESARRCMTDTLTGAGGRSGGQRAETERSVNPPTPLDIRLPMPSVSSQHLESLRHCIGTLKTSQVFVLNQKSVTDSYSPNLSSQACRWKCPFGSVKEHQAPCHHCTFGCLVSCDQVVD